MFEVELFDCQVDYSGINVDKQYIVYNMDYGLVFGEVVQVIKLVVICFVIDYRCEVLIGNNISVLKDIVICLFV